MATKATSKAKKPAAAKAAPAKKTAAKKPAAKKAAPAKKAAAVKAKPAAAKGAMKKGTKYACSVCGLVVAVDTVCNCVGECDIVCCEMPMVIVSK